MRRKAGTPMSLKHSNATIGNRTRDLPACSAVPQLTAPTCGGFVECTVGFIPSLA